MPAAASDYMLDCERQQDFAPSTLAHVTNTYVTV